MPHDKRGVPCLEDGHSIGTTQFARNKGSKQILGVNTGMQHFRMARLAFKQKHEIHNCTRIT